MKLAPENAIETLRAMLAGNPAVHGAEVVIRARKGLRIETAQEKLQSLQNSESFGAGLRIQKGRRVAQSYCSTLEVPALRALAAQTFEMLEEVPEDCENTIEPMDFSGDPQLGSGNVDPTFAQVDTEEKITRLINLESNILRFDPRIKRTRSVDYWESFKREWIWTLGSNKALFSSSTAGQLSASAVAEVSGDSQIGWSDLSETHYYDLDWSLVAKNACTMALKLLEAKPVASGLYNVIFLNTVTPDLLRLLTHALSGETVERGLSFLKRSLHQNVFAKTLHVFDDPYQKKRLGSCAWDAEGTPTTRLTLIHQGKVEAFAHNKNSARRAGAQSTGHAGRASERSALTIGFHNPMIEPGKKDLVDLYRDLGRGLVIYKLLGLHSANLSTGDFSFGAMGTWVENGEELRSVSGITLAGNLRDLFARLVSPGRDLRWDAHYGAPSLLCEGISVAGT